MSGSAERSRLPRLSHADRMQQMSEFASGELSTCGRGTLRQRALVDHLLDDHSKSTNFVGSPLNEPEGIWHGVVSRRKMHSTALQARKVAAETPRSDASRLIHGHRKEYAPPPRAGPPHCRLRPSRDRRELFSRVGC